MDLCEFEYLICTKIFPSYTPLTLGQTYIDIVFPLIEWVLMTKGCTEKVNTGDLVIGDRVYQKKNADEVSWL